MSLIPFGFWGAQQDSFLPIADYPTYGWSFWKRNASYTGSCIRVIRSSDNVEQDIGFGGDNFLNTTALLSFIGGNNGFVKTFYDQFGDVNISRPSWSSNTDLCPRVVNSGVLETFANGQATMQWGVNPGSNGWNTLQGGSGINMLPNTNSTILWVEQNGASITNILLGNTNNTSAFGTRQISGVVGTFVNFDIGVAENYFVNESKLIEGYNNSLYAITGDLYDVASYRVSTDGARLFGSRGVGYNSLGTGISYGGRYDNIGDPFLGKSNELLLYPGVTLSEAKVIEIQSILNKSHQFYNSNNITKDLILWYDAGNVSSYPGSGTAITDLSVGGAAATLVGGITYSSSDGGKFVLDGVDDWIGSSGTNNYPWTVLGGDFSIEIWCKPSNINQGVVLFGNRNNSTTTQLALYVGSIDLFGGLTASKRISGVIINSGATRAKYYQSTTDVVDGGWKHIIMTRSSNTMKLYVNGAELTFNNEGGLGGSNLNYIASSTSWRISDNGSGGGGGYTGDVSIMRLYKCALTQAQVTRNYNLEKSRYGL